MFHPKHVLFSLKNTRRMIFKSIVVFIKHHFSYCYLQYLISEDTEKNSQRLKNDFLEGENLIDEWSVEFNSQPSKDLKYQRQPSKAYMFTVNRQKLKSIPTVKQLKEHLYLSRLLTKFLET